MSDLEKKKEKERWEQIRKTLSNKKKRESQYRKTIIEREQSRKKRLSPIPESKEKNGGKNRKTKRKTNKVQKLKKPFSKKLGGVSPPSRRQFRDIIRDILSNYRNRLLDNQNRVPMLRFGYYVFNILEELYRYNGNKDYINAVYVIITDSNTIISLYKDSLNVRRSNVQRRRRVNGFEYIIAYILNTFNEIIDNGPIDDVILINTLIYQERSELTGEEEYQPEIESTIVELQSLDPDSVGITRNQKNTMLRKYINFINNPIFIEDFISRNYYPETPPFTPPGTPPEPFTPPGTPPN